MIFLELKAEEGFLTALTFSLWANLTPRGGHEKEGKRVNNPSNNPALLLLNSARQHTAPQELAVSSPIAGSSRTHWFHALSSSAPSPDTSSLGRSFLTPAWKTGLDAPHTSLLAGEGFS